MHTIAVTGPGTMGNEVAHAAAIAGLTVRPIDTTEEPGRRSRRFTTTGNDRRGLVF